MDKNKPIHSVNKNKTLATKLGQKDWVKKLEESSGKPLNLNTKPIGVELRTVYLLVDCSSSMAEEDKMQQAKKGAIGFLYETQKKEYSVGLVQFASCAKHLLGPQRESTKLAAKIEEMVAYGSTDMSDAIQIATENLANITGERVICIVTDGMPDSEVDTLDAANEAKAKGIDIMAIGTDDADRDFLKRLASRTNLSMKVQRNQLADGIVSIAKMLPESNEKK